ncbi:phage tail sheath family protein [Flavobacterium sp. RHBU_3]|uniref:phage tail sheath family protein n=1 Tax=Flavobacterium sp. RHBU_3 TaxID=3391184 RepID=UPI003985038F
MSEIKTPGVYVEEVSKFPPSVAQVETAVPTFIGYTQTSPAALVPKRITSLVEYETYFGGANKEKIVLHDTVDGLTLEKPDATFLMYYSLQMYFANGGGPCYIVSVGNYPTTPINTTWKTSALSAWESVEESTLVVFPDAVNLEEVDFYALYQDAISKAETLKNRFVILDTYKGNLNVDAVTQTTTIEDIRDNVPSSIQAAAYFPHLKTALNYTFNEDANIEHTGLQTTASQPFFVDEKNQLTVLQSQISSATGAAVVADLLEQVIAIVDEINLTADGHVSTTDVVADFNQASAVNGTINASVNTHITALISAVNSAKDEKGAADGVSLNSIKTTNSNLYNQIKKLIGALNVVLPPSSSIAGVYAKTDGTKGVWKAPANVGLNYVVAPTEKISDEEQEDLNIDTTAGKSVNAIRTFSGKGTLVWGARTFDSNDNEWRYISVRRLFDMIEKSVQNATERFVFEVNDASTWVKVKAMIENYLNQLWMSGALAGSKPEQAYQVRVGIPDGTMVDTDVNEGRMNIEVAIAAVRPAEFIVLRFSHKLQEA